jgi:hypothetical protein
MSNGSRLSGANRRRNDWVPRLRAVVARQTAVLAFDLAAVKQVCAWETETLMSMGRCVMRPRGRQDDVASNQAFPLRLWNRVGSTQPRTPVATDV